MLLKKKKPPTTQRRFTSPWLELDYLCTKVRFWLYTRKAKHRAERYLKRLENVLAHVPENEVAIIRQEGFALLHELMGNVSASIVHRQREIELIERLHREARLPRYSESTRAYMLQGLDEAALQERREVLKSLMRRKLDADSNGTRVTK